MKKAALTDAAGADHSGAADTAIIAPGTHCSNAALCRRWSAFEHGAYCRLCWRDFTNPKPLHITEGRA